MASVRSAGLVFGVIIVSFALKYSFACAQEAGSGTTRKNRWLAGIEYENLESSQNQNFLNGVSEAEALANIAGRKVLNGRKMEVINRLSKQLDKKSKLLAGDHVSDKTSKSASGQDSSSMEAKVSTKSVDHHLHQDKSTSSSSSSSKSYSEAAAYEIMRQNHGDYTNNNAPHKNPPVNNDKPKN